MIIIYAFYHIHDFLPLRIIFPSAALSFLTSLDVKLREKDRVEIYRPLIADPKEVRKQRATEGKIMRSGKKS